MKKQLLLRSLIGMPIGVTISFLVTIFVSLGIGDGRFYSVEPQLAAALGSELSAVIVQFIVSALYGALWAGASVIWEMENWSVLRMTLVHFAAMAIPTFPIAWYLHWMPHNPAGVSVYFGIFLAIYASIWAAQYGVMKKRVRKLNEKLSER